MSARHVLTHFWFHHNLFCATRFPLFDKRVARNLAHHWPGHVNRQLLRWTPEEWLELHDWVNIHG